MDVLIIFQVTLSHYARQPFPPTTLDWGPRSSVIDKPSCFGGQSQTIRSHLSSQVGLSMPADRSLRAPLSRSHKYSLDTCDHNQTRSCIITLAMHTFGLANTSSMSGIQGRRLVIKALLRHRNWLHSRVCHPIRRRHHGLLARFLRCQSGNLSPSNG